MDLQRGQVEDTRGWGKQEDVSYVPEELALEHVKPPNHDPLKFKLSVACCGSWV